MLQERIFNNLEHDHLQQTTEESNLFCDAETSTSESQNSSNSSQTSHPQKNLTKVFITVFVLLVALNAYKCLATFFRSAVLYNDIFTERNPLLIQQRFPKILWVYTENERDAEHLEEDIYYNYFAHLAQTVQYEVRYVNSLTAYDYLSNQTIKNITETMNKRTVDQTVHNFLKLALLIEKGGLLIQPGTILIDNDFKWIQYMFDKYSIDFQVYNCKTEDSSLFIPKNGDLYDTMIVAALPQNPLLKQLLEFMREVVVNAQLKRQHTLPSRYNIAGLFWNSTTKVYGFRNILSNCINHLLNMINEREQKCYLGMQQPTVNMTLFMESDEKPSPDAVATKIWGFQELMYSKDLTNAKTVKAIKGFNNKKIISIITDLALGKQTLSSIQNTLIYKVLEVPGNRQIFLEKLPQREIELCLVIMEGLNNQQILHTSTLFNDQSYTNWRLVMPANDIKKAPKFADYRISVMQSKSTKVHNIEKAVTLHCPHKGYAVVLNYNETFVNRSALYNIAKAAQPRQVVGVYIPLKSNNQYHGVNQPYTTFYRYQDGIVNPKLDLMKHMINHLRVFSVQTFKTIPQFALRDWDGKYLNDRLIFLMDFHDLIHREIRQPEQLLTIKKNANLWNIPTQVSILDYVALLKVTQLEQVDREQLKITHARVSARNMETILYDLHRYKIPMSKMVAFNPGEDFVPVHQKKGPELIPRIIHQVWLGSAIPPAKQYLIQKTKKIYPSYEVKVWRQQNITRELFPNTYDVIQTLLDFNKRSPFNKLATVTDIMRHEILYREGGLWRDAGMNMLRPIPDAFLKYKLILPTDRLYQYRYIQGMCFFGNMPKYENMLRINNFKNLNRMRIHSNDPFPIAGPVDFRQLLKGQEEFDPQILLLPYQTFYPGQVGQHPENDLCTTRQLKDNQKYQIVEGGWYLLSGCQQKYPYAFAIEHNNYGSSWVGAKQLQNL